MTERLQTHLEAVIRAREQAEANYEARGVAAGLADTVHAAAVENLARTCATDQQAWIAADKLLFDRTVELMDALNRLKTSEALVHIMISREGTIRALLESWVTPHSQ